MTLPNYHDSGEAATPSLTTNPVAAAIAKRRTKRQAIEQFFAANLGHKFPSSDLHAKYGSAFRTRVSDINRDLAASVTIRNSITAQSDGFEISVYWAEARG